MKSRICLGCCHGILQPNAGDWNCDLFCSGDCAALNWAQNYNVPAAFTKTIESKIPNQKGVARALSWAKSLVDFKAKHQFGLVCHGRTSGNGKTRTGTLAQMQLIGHGHEFGWAWMGSEKEERLMSEDWSGCGQWLSAMSFKTKHLKVCRKSEERAKWFESLCYCDVLLLDDIDKISASEGLLETLFGVLDYRLHSEKVTIMTTNLVGEELAGEWTVGAGSKTDDRYGKALVRRIREECLCLNFDIAIGKPNVIPMSA